VKLGLLPLAIARVEITTVDNFVRIYFRHDFGAECAPTLPPLGIAIRVGDEL
jgi:hypothetical protein